MKTTLDKVLECLHPITIAAGCLPNSVILTVNHSTEEWTIKFRNQTDIEHFLFKMNRLLDRLECTDFQATRWRTQRDVLQSRVEALEEQNEALTKAYTEVLLYGRKDIIKKELDRTTVP